MSSPCNVQCTRNRRREAQVVVGRGDAVGQRQCAILQRVGCRKGRSHRQGHRRTGKGGDGGALSNTKTGDDLAGCEGGARGRHRHSGADGSGGADAKRRVQGRRGNAARVVKRQAA